MGREVGGCGSAQQIAVFDVHIMVVVVNIVSVDRMYLCM